MTVIHIAAGLRETCGVSQFVVHVARAQREAGHDVTVVTTRVYGCPTDGLRVILTPDPTSALKLFVGQSAVVHIHALWNGYVHRAARWCRRHGVPFVLSPHGMMTRWSMHYRWWKKIPAWWLYQKRDCRAAAAFHVTVPDEEADVRRLGFGQTVIVAPLGAEVSPPAQTACDKTSDVQSHAPRTVLSIGRIHPKKNLDALIRAWAILKPGSYSARLVIAGSDDVGHRAELELLARSLGLADVVFAGPVYGTEKDDLFARAWVSVLPSHSENFGGVVTESLAQGTPVIASMGTPWRELPQAGCGWWIEATPEILAETLREALSISAERRTAMSRAARELVRAKYSWSASAARLTAAMAACARGVSRREKW